MNSQILNVIENINIIFEYYFEDYLEIDESNIWWIPIIDQQTKKTNWKHIANFCQKQGDLAIHYYQNGYCALYAQILKFLFPSGKIYDNLEHFIFFYEGEFYDASGKLTILDHNFQETNENFSLNLASKYSNITSEANLELARKMVEKGRQIIEQTPIKKIER